MEDNRQESNHTQELEKIIKIPKKNLRRENDDKT